MATGPIETHLHRSFNWENAAPGAREGPRGRSGSCGNVLSAQCVRLRSEINLNGKLRSMFHSAKINWQPFCSQNPSPERIVYYNF